MITRLTILAAAASLAAGASAATMTETVTWGAGGDLTTDPGQAVYVPAFDPSLGTLTGVDVAVSATVSWAEPMTSFGNNSTVEVVPAVTDLFIFPQGSSPLLSLTSSQLATLTPSLPDPGESATLSGDFADDPAAYLSGLIYAPTGPSRVLFVRPDGYFDIVNCVSGCVYEPLNDVGGFASGNFTVTFTYTPAVSVPEPESLALLGTGLLGLLGLRRLHGRF